MSSTEPKHTIELTDKEVYVLKSALERFCDIEDGSYVGAVNIGEGIYGRLPQVNVKWEDIQNTDED